MIQATAECYEAGRMVGAGSFVCRECGSRFVLKAADRIPQCSACGATSFRRGSIFKLDPELMEQPTLEGAVTPSPEEETGWIEEVRSELGEPGHFVAFRDDAETHVIRLEEGWSRVGRSIAASIRLDDPTVSRRHALIVKTPDGRVRVLDDRSLNGVFVNGERVEWSRLNDGDEIAIGRYRLHLLEAAAVPSLG